MPSISYKNVEGFKYNIEPRRKISNSPSIHDLALATEQLLDYEFSSEKVCEQVIANGAERKRLAKLPCIPNFGHDAEIAAAARESGLGKLLGLDSKEKALAAMVKALLGAICEDSDCEGDVLRAASCLGLQVVEQDLLGVEELEFAPFVASVPVVESLI